MKTISFTNNKNKLFSNISHCLLYFCLLLPINFSFANDNNEPADASNLAEGETVESETTEDETVEDKVVQDNDSIQITAFDKTPIQIATASNFKPIVEALFKNYPPEINRPVHWISGSSGQLFFQIKAKAPFAAYISANSRYVDQLTLDTPPEEALETFTIAYGQLAYWCPRRCEDLSITSFYESFKTYSMIATANPNIAPYGEAANSTLKWLGKEHSTLFNLRPLHAPNAQQAFNWVHQGNLEHGFVPLSLLKYHKAQASKYITIPSRWHKPLPLTWVTLTNSSQLETLSDKEALAIIKRWLTSANIKEKLKAYGYMIPKTPDS